MYTQRLLKEWCADKFRQFRNYLLVYKEALKYNIVVCITV